MPSQNNPGGLGNRSGYLSTPDETLSILRSVAHCTYLQGSPEINSITTLGSHPKGPHVDQTHRQQPSDANISQAQALKSSIMCSLIPQPQTGMPPADSSYWVSTFYQWFCQDLCHEHSVLVLLQIMVSGGRYLKGWLVGCWW